MYGIVQNTLERLYQKFRGLDTRVTALEDSGGGPPPGSAVTLTGDVNGQSDNNLITYIGGTEITSLPAALGELFGYDASTGSYMAVPGGSNGLLLQADSNNTTTGLAYTKIIPAGEVHITNDNINISASTRLQVIDFTGISTGTYNVILPSITEFSQELYLKIMGQGSLALVTLDSEGASNGFDPIPLTPAVTQLTNLGVGIVVTLYPDLTNNCWWVVGFSYF